MVKQPDESGGVSSFFLRYYILIGILIFAFSIFFGYSFDESVFSGYAANYYYYNENPFYFWGMGAYYLGIDIAGYFPSIILNLVGFHNVLVEELGVKIPIDLGAFISGLLLYKILLKLNVNQKYSESAALIFLVSPLLFFYAPFQGNPLDVTLMFLLAMILCIQSERYYLGSVFLAIATANYLYPIFLVPIVLFYMFYNTKRSKAFLSMLLYFIIAGIGISAQYVSYIVAGISFSSGTAVSTNNGVASLSSAIFHPPIWNTYYFLNIFRVGFPYYGFQIIFIIAMILPTFLIIIKKNRKGVSITELIMIMSLQGLTFAFFSPISDPQYILAALPFIIVLVFLTRKLSLMYLLYTATFLGLIMVAYVVPYNFNQYFVDVNPAAGSIQLFLSPTVLSLLSIIYSAIGIILIINIAILFIKNKSKNYFSRFSRKIRHLIPLSGLTIIVFIVVSFIIIYPGLYHIPQQFAYQANDSRSSVDFSSVTYNNTTEVDTINFKEPSTWNSIQNNIKNMSSVGLYAYLTPRPLKYGFIGGNDIFPVNSSHYLGESFYIPFNAKIELLIGFINDSFKMANVYLVKNNGDQLESKIATFTNFTRASYYNTFPVSEAEYIISFQINQNLTPGNYSVIVAGTSSETVYLGGWNGDPGTQNIQSIFIIGNGSQIDVGNQIKHMRFSLSVNVYYNGPLNVTINGKPLSLLANGFEGINNRIPTILIKENNSMTFSQDIFNYFNTPTVYYYVPFPSNDDRLIFLNFKNFVLGSVLFTGLTVFSIYSILILLRPMNQEKTKKQFRWVK